MYRNDTRHTILLFIYTTHEIHFIQINTFITLYAVFTAKQTTSIDPITFVVNTVFVAMILTVLSIRQ